MIDIFAKLIWILIFVNLLSIFINPYMFLIITFNLIILIIIFFFITVYTKEYLKLEGKKSLKEKEIDKRFYGDWGVRIFLFLFFVAFIPTPFWFSGVLSSPFFEIQLIIAAISMIYLLIRYKKYKNEVEK